MSVVLEQIVCWSKIGCKRVSRMVAVIQCRSSRTRSQTLGVCRLSYWVVSFDSGSLWMGFRCFTPWNVLHNSDNLHGG